MANRLVITNGASTKGINPWDVDQYPDAWEWLSGKQQTEQEQFYATVAAVFRAFNLKANTVASIPFTLYTESGEEYDNSNDWKNKVKFLPNPQELLRLATLSYITSNAIYHLRTSDALGYKTKGLYHAIPTSFTPVVNPATQQLQYIERQVGSQLERYTPDDKRLVRMWRLDHTTEVLPSPHTEAKSIMKSAGIMHYQDAWVEHFYRRGGIKPTLIAMKGLVNNNDKETKEKDWSSFLRGLGKFTNRIARIFNAEAMTIQPFGSGVDDLKDNKIYEQAIANIAMGTGMPLSLLLANSANYATAQEEKATWYESDIIPFTRWLCYGYNEQLFKPMGLYMQFQPQTLDPNQQDETEKANAISQYMKIVLEAPTLEIFEGLADTIGIELSETLLDALKAYYAKKEKEQEKPVEVQPITPEPEQPTEEADDMEDMPEDMPAKWIPSIDEVKELGVWRDVALRKFKKGEGLSFEYVPHYGGLPESVRKNIWLKLSFAKTADDIKAAFELDKPDMLFAPQESEILKLAAALNNVAEAMKNDKDRA